MTPKSGREGRRERESPLYIRHAVGTGGDMTGLLNKWGTMDAWESPREMRPNSNEREGGGAEKGGGGKCFKLRPFDAPVAVEGATGWIETTAKAILWGCLLPQADIIIIIDRRTGAKAGEHRGPSRGGRGGGGLTA
jgi:hypothetical protein